MHVYLQIKIKIIIHVHVDQLDVNVHRLFANESI